MPKATVEGGWVYLTSADPIAYRTRLKFPRDKTRPLGCGSNLHLPLITHRANTYPYFKIGKHNEGIGLFYFLWPIP